MEMHHLRGLSHARYGGHFCPFRAKNREISQHIPTEFQIFAFLPQKFGAVTSKCDSSVNFAYGMGFARPIRKYSRMVSLRYTRLDMLLVFVNHFGKTPSCGDNVR